MLQVLQEALTVGNGRSLLRGVIKASLREKKLIFSWLPCLSCRVVGDGIQSLASRGREKWRPLKWGKL